MRIDRLPTKGPATPPSSRAGSAKPAARTYLLGGVESPGELGERHPAVLGQRVHDLAIERVDTRGVLSHGEPSARDETPQRQSSASVEFTPSRLIGAARQRLMGHPQEIVPKEAKMAAIVESIEISRRPEDLFAYVTDPTHLPEWQDNVVSVRPEGETLPSLGSKVVVTRRVGPREWPTTSELAELDPPTSWGVRGVDGPVRGIVKGTIEPLDNGARSRVTIALDFEGHGIGRLLVPLVVRPQARRQMPRNERRLKELLERGT